MELKSIAIENFKRISNLNVDLGTTTIFVGANGSGKSSALQALHLASCVARQAPAIEKGKANTISITELDYLPSNEYKKLGHQAEWGNSNTSPHSKVTFRHQENEELLHTTEIVIRSARNAGISASGSIAPATNNLFRNKSAFFSAYASGLSGIPNAEKRDSKRVVLRASSFGDSNVYLRNILLILKEEKPQTLQQIQNALADLMVETKIHVEFDVERDLIIKCYFERDGMKQPLELLGTGFIQAIQMISYIYLFQPQVLLIDEPDTHLHPSAQERIVATLEKAAKQFGTKIIMTTHSPFIVRGATSTTKVYWLKDGTLFSENRALVESALGWGAMGKKLLVLTEDSKTSMLRTIVRQWPDIDRQIAILPGSGFRNLPSSNQAKELYESLDQSLRILVLRDRDALQENEVIKLKTDYAQQGISLEFTDFSDIEEYFCKVECLTSCLSIDGASAQALIDEVCSKNLQPIKEQFAKRRKAHNEEIYTGGGSPDTEQLWLGLNGPSEATIKGKFLLAKLCDNPSISKQFKTREIYIENACRGNVALGLKATLLKNIA